MAPQLLRPRERTPKADERPMDHPSNRRGTRIGVLWGLLICAVVAFIIVVAHNARRGAVATRIKNPNVQGAPRPVRPLFGWTHWVTFLQISTVVALVLVV